MDETRAKLQELVKQLRKLSFPSSPIDVEDAQFVASAFERYLTGKAKTLDAAFGLAPKRGAPRKNAKHEAIARKVDKLRKEGLP